MKTFGRAIAVAVCGACLLPAAAAAKSKETYTTVTSPVTSGPADCSKIRVLKIGPSSAKNVLVLIPGYLGGSGDFRVIGQRLTGKLKKLQVWGIDRRSQCLEDTSGFLTGKPVDAFGYYIFGQTLGGKKFTPPFVSGNPLLSTPDVSSPGAEAARSWGLATTMADIHAVVQSAKTGHRKVILGGHSLGGSLTDLYAAWDFSGVAGYKDVAGMVLIDGGARGTFDGPAPAAWDSTHKVDPSKPDLGYAKGSSVTKDSTTWTADEKVAASDVPGASAKWVTPNQYVLNEVSRLATGNPFSSLVSGIPVEDQGIFPELSAKYATKDPNGAAALQGFLKNVGLGAFTRPITPNPAPPAPKLGSSASGLMTNEAGLGYAFDRDSSPSFVGLLHMNLGQLKENNAPGGLASWQNGGLTDISDVKTLFGTEPGNFVEWYFPKRLSIDVGAATSLSKTALTDSLGLRPWHFADVNVPLYAFETGLTCSARPLPADSGFAAWIAANTATRCGVLTGAQSFVAGSKVPRSTLVSDHDSEHLDPLVARATANKFQTTVIPFLKSLGVN